jgi:hypothetical protein
MTQVSSSNRVTTSPLGDSLRMDLVAAGAALTVALVGLFIVCDIIALVWPAAGLAHGWVRLFATNPDNAGLTLAQGVIGSALAAWLVAALFVPVYNWMVRRPAA